jgi:hypothetical protein
MPLGLRAERTDAAERRASDAALLQILEPIEPFGGDCDGWEPPVTMPPAV